MVRIFSETKFGHASKPAISDNVHWGILGAGRIARKFAASLRELPDARLAAAGSQSGERAQARREEFNVPRRHANYEALAGDPTVDVVYVATRIQCISRTHCFACALANRWCAKNLLR